MQTRASPRPPVRESAKGAPSRRRAGPSAVHHRPTRTCVGCRKPGDPTELVRMVLSQDGVVGFDLAGGATGRGAWVHPTEPCLQKASKAVLRSLHGEVEHSAGSEHLTALIQSLAAAAARRAQGLILAARRTRQIMIGGEASQRAFLSGKARAVILAGDAMAAARQAWISEAATQGLLAVWTSKAELGAMVGRDELAVMVVTDDGLAKNLLRVIEMMRPVTSRLAKANHDAAAVLIAARTTGSQGRQDSEDG
ncbi:MAG TPA: DUF448 domain-containing protein [Polyangiaceae bacterium]|nr:DUF448 domain-containing protein [Polyangiaceae bacterium]